MLQSRAGVIWRGRRAATVYKRPPGKHCHIAGAFLVALVASPIPALADGLFVFKWNKEIDINEPTQKGVIVYNAGREDLLLQVKYEGPLEEFGWLIPVPSLPEVRKGSMDPFYELSELTQRRFGTGYREGDIMTLSASVMAAEEVKVIEIKTVGAYEVAVLSAKDADSLERWLKAHGFSIPDGKTEFVDEYIRRGWYFVAARIQLNRGIAFKTVSSPSPKDADARARARKTLQQKLSTGELHPVLISFDSPQCIYPLKITAAGGKPSEVSLYVLSREPLLNPFTFDKARTKVEQRQSEWEAERPQREIWRRTGAQNMRTLQLALVLRSLDRDTPSGRRGLPQDDWPLDELSAIANEGQPPVQSSFLDEDFWVAPAELLQCMPVKPDQIPKCRRAFPRLQAGDWYLTKQVWTFDPAEMHDLEFEPAIPALARLLPHPAGCAAAEALVEFGANALPLILAASQSPNATERLNATRFLGRIQDQRAAPVILKLLQDSVPQVRYQAIQAAEKNWAQQFVEPLIALFRDPEREIRQRACALLSARETMNRTHVYFAMLDDPDWNVRACALSVLERINSDAIPADSWSQMLNCPDPSIQGTALKMLFRLDGVRVPRSDLVQFLTSTNLDNLFLAVSLLRAAGGLTLDEISLLLSHKLARARLHGLMFLRRAGSARCRTRSAFAQGHQLGGPDCGFPDPARPDRRGHFRPRPGSVGTMVGNK